MFEMDQELTTTLSILLPLVLTLGGLAFAISVDLYFEKKQKRVFLLILGLVFCLIGQNYTELLTIIGSPRIQLRTFLAIFGYSLRPAILLLFFYLVEPEHRFWPGWVLVGLNAAIHCTALFSDICFCIDHNNAYQGGPLSSTCLVISALLLAALFWLTLRRSRKNPGKELWIPLIIVPLILGGVILDDHVAYSKQIVSFLTIAIVISCVLYYLWLHLQMVREQLRMQLMFSQIKPHFLYNTLGSIEGLCLSDPKAASEATARFSEYLRVNLAAISKDQTIPFTQELSHTRVYLELEQTRFEDALRVVYDIPVTDFFLPPLTLEPLVENAVRHGVRMKPNGRGTVTISTRELPDCWEITVLDDGPGFDPSASPSDGKPHIGIENVRQRLERLCDGTLTIQSASGQGTSATIRLPKRQREGIRGKRGRQRRTVCATGRGIRYPGGQKR